MLCFVFHNLWARDEGQGRRGAAQGDRSRQMGPCLALCSVLNCLVLAPEPRDLQQGEGGLFLFELFFAFDE
jgi:hypothetical protein